MEQVVGLYAIELSRRSPATPTFRRNMYRIYMRARQNHV
jgi:hypothetical protein